MRLLRESGGADGVWEPEQGFTGSCCRNLGERPQWPVPGQEQE